MPSTTGGPAGVTVIMAVVLGIYWAALFYATHMPIPQGMLPGNSDKFIHFVAYCGLGTLLMGLVATRGPIKWPGVIICWLILATYGVFDELTQLLVSRNADVRDWLYDISGAATGLLVVASLVWCVRPKLHESF